jgi:branched-chain amino acid aminotransferase
MHPFVLHNDLIREAAEPLLSPGQVGLLAGWGVFSTIRVSSGVLFAFERHWERMQRDAAALCVPFPSDPEYLRSRLLELVRANAALDASLRVIIVRNRGGVWEGPNERDFDLIGFTADLKDWGAGVRLGLQAGGRHAASPFAGAKSLSWAHNLVFLDRAHEKGFDEVVLLNERGEVSECTSANIFVTTGNEVWTPPLHSGCLPGVTRELLLEEVRVEDISVREKTLRPTDLEQADEVFITSTTRNLLPVLSVEGLSIRRAGAACRLLENAFSRLLERYVAGHRPSPAPAGKS